jgi:hypothetical protein
MPSPASLTSLPSQHHAITSTPDSLSLPSAFLSQLNVPAQLVEVKAIDLRNPDDLSELLRSDIPVLFSSFSAKQPEVFRALKVYPNPNTICIFNGSSSEDIGPALSDSSPKILFIDPRRAKDAVELFLSNGTSALQKYQDEFTQSNLPTLVSALKSIVSSSSSSHTALSQIHAALFQCRETLQNYKNVANQVLVAASDLETHVKENKIKIAREIFGSDDTEEKNEVSVALRHAEQQMKATIDYLSWRRALSRVDEISLIVGAALEQAWCRDLEKKVCLSFVNTLI